MRNDKLISFTLSMLIAATTLQAQDQVLNTQQQSLVSISALTAVGDVEKLKAQLHIGLDAGLTINEIKEMLTHLYAYCGFPRSLNAINTLSLVLDERKSKGVADKTGKEIFQNYTTDKYEQGRKVLEALTNTPQSKPAPGFGEFAPRIDAFLKEHLFADVFSSDVLSYQQRELITLSALTAMPGVSSQLQSHIKMGMNTGLTENQLEHVASLIEKYINRTQANTLRKLISKPEMAVVEPDMMVRISEIEIFPEHLAEYKAILKEEAAASVKLEPGVISIFSMWQKENPSQVRIIEIYRNHSAYQSHLQTQHFQHYKTTTLKMVKTLMLVDMEVLDKESMSLIFEKLN